jgi:uncharacterized membrane protein
MLGIHGLDSFGLLHALIGVAALALGLAAVVPTKGTRQHRYIGRAYVASMMLLNLTGLAIYDLTGRFGPFHVAAIVSLATVAAGFMSALAHVGNTQWTTMHGIFMSWSYVGLLAALISEIAVRVPGVRFGLGVTVTTAVVVAGGAALIHIRVPRIAERLTRRQPPHA